MKRRWCRMNGADVWSTLERRLWKAGQQSSECWRRLKCTGCTVQSAQCVWAQQCSEPECTARHWTRQPALLSSLCCRSLQSAQPKVANWEAALWFSLLSRSLHRFNGSITEIEPARHRVTRAWSNGVVHLNLICISESTRNDAISLLWWHSAKRDTLMLHSTASTSARPCQKCRTFRPIHARTFTHTHFAAVAGNGLSASRTLLLTLVVFAGMQPEKRKRERET